MMLFVSQPRDYLYKQRVKDQQYKTLKCLALNTASVIFYNAVIKKKKSRIWKFKFFKSLQNFTTNLDAS